MRVILKEDHTNQKVFTGNSTKWPDGLYVNDDGDFHILVDDGRSVRLDFDGVFFPNPNTGSKYTKLPGYTGRISSITPEVKE
jgi:hypothetical protein